MVPKVVLMRRMLDLFSGLGGASEAFVRDQGWEVVRVENEPLLEGVECTRMMDVTDVLDSDLVGTWDLIWASPPCTEFSRAYNAPAPKAQREGREFKPDLSLVRAAVAIIECLEPKWWVIENVHGAMKPLMPILGPPTLLVGPFALWGSIPPLDLPKGFKHAKSDNDTGGHDPLRSQRRAVVPLEISQALLEAVTSQTTLDQF